MPRASITRAVLVAALLAVGCQEDAAKVWPPGVVARVTLAEGDTHVLKAGVERPAVESLELALEDTVVAGPGSFVVLQLVNGHLVKVDEDLSLKVSDIALLGAPPTRTGLEEQLASLLQEEHGEGEARIAAWEARRAAGEAFVPGAQTAPRSKELATEGVARGDGPARAEGPASGVQAPEPKRAPGPPPAPAPAPAPEVVAAEPPREAAPAPAVAAAEPSREADSRSEAGTKEAPRGKAGASLQRAPASPAAAGAPPQQAPASPAAAGAPLQQAPASPAAAGAPEVVDPALVDALFASPAVASCLKAHLATLGVSRERVTVRFRVRLGLVQRVGLDHGLPMPRCARDALEAPLQRMRRAGLADGWHTKDVELR